MNADGSLPGTKTAFISHFDCSRHDPGWGHPEHQGRLPSLMRAVYAAMPELFGVLDEVSGRHATETELRLFHTDEYLRRVRGWAVEAETAGRPVQIAPGLMVSAASWDASLAAVGSVLVGIDAVVGGTARNAFCAIRPPGRDSSPAAPGRFGFLNPIAVAARAALAVSGIDRVLAIEWGSLTSSSHGPLSQDSSIRVARIGALTAGSEPGQRAFEVSLPPGSDGSRFQLALVALLTEATADFRPDLMLLSAGFDLLRGDPLGSLALTPADYYRATLEVVERAGRISGGRIVSVLEGGYDARGLGAAAVQHLRALSGLPLRAR